MSSQPPSPTFFITDRRMLQHRCEWDSDHIERPERLSAILDLLENERVLSKCTILESKECSQDDLLAVHNPEHIDLIRSTSTVTDLDALEQLCSQHEDIFVNGKSWECALLSAGCAVKAMEAVLEANKSAAENSSSAPNAFAAIRPPGHHASRNLPCGFCLFNNVAICARRARSLGVERVLILDWDVHAAQGTQYCAQEDPEGILLISAHRFDRGEFWPELAESAMVHKYSNTLNVPLNGIGHGDAEYAALMHFLVLPIIQQWRPGLILVSCGFDAGIGDPQGEMCVSPACFGYMTGLLAQFSNIPLCLLLEGGYFIPTVAQGALYCVRALLLRAPPLKHFCEMVPSPDFLYALFANQLVHALKWPLFAHWVQSLNALRAEKDELQLIELPQAEYIGNRKLLLPQPTRGQYPPRKLEVEREFEQRLRTLMEHHEKRVQLRRELLEVAVQRDTHRGNSMLLLKPPGGAIGEKFALYGRDHFLTIYFFVLLPLAFYTVDLHTAEGKQSLPLPANELDKLVEQVDNEIISGEEGLELEVKVLKQFLAVFPKLNAYLLFQPSQF